MEREQPLRKKARRNSPKKKKPDFTKKEAEGYLSRVHDIIYIRYIDGFEKISPTLIQKYTKGAGCYRFMKQMFKQMLFSERFCLTHDKIPDLREMLAVAIAKGYHHGVVANIAVHGSRKYTGFLLFQDVFFKGLKADMVKLMFRLDMLTNRDMFILKELVESFGERFMEAVENIDDPEEYKNAYVLDDHEFEEEDFSDSDEDEVMDSDEDDEDYEMPEFAAFLVHTEYVNDCRERDDTMKFIQEAASNPKSLKDLAAMAVSKGVGHKNNRAALVEKLDDSEVLKSSIMHQEAAIALKKSARFCECDFAFDKLCVCMLLCPCDCLGGINCVCVHKQPAEATDTRVAK